MKNNESIEKVVTSYKNPDLDGVACMYAYSELLNIQGIPSSYYIWDEPKKEVFLLAEMFQINLQSLKKEEISENSEFVVVDLNGLDQLPEIVDAQKVVEIIDHHGLSNWLPFYSNIQRLQIDRLGAAATIVAERYRNLSINPSRESAILLFYAIISNSINLKANYTKQRDKDACRWLKSICPEISEEKIEEIFLKKSKINEEDLRSEMECEIPNTFPEFQVIIAQLEIANAEGFLNEKKEKILNILKQVKKEKNITYIFLNCVDILKGVSFVLPADKESQEFVHQTFGYCFSAERYFKDRQNYTKKRNDHHFKRKI